MGRIATFIDAAYLNFMSKNEFGGTRIDYARLAAKIADRHELLRTYYYDCLPYQSSPPTPDEQNRFGKHQRFHAKLAAIPRFEVRLGKLEFRGNRSDGAPIFQQKRVDILMGVDLVSLAAKHQITDAAILAGDSDFLPAIEVAKAEGVVVHLYHGASPHRDLLSKCDERIPLDSTFMASVRLPS